MLFFIAPIAQLVEQLPFKEWVVGSTPTGRTKRAFAKKYREGSRKQEEQVLE